MIVRSVSVLPVHCMCSATPNSARHAPLDMLITSSGRSQVTVQRSTLQMATDGAICNDSISPHWIKDGELVPSELKVVVTEHANKLSSVSLDAQLEGAEAFLSLVNSAWNLETHVARDSADLIAMEIR